MKSVWVFGIIYLVLLPLLAIGCDQSSGTVEADKTIEVTLDQFADKNNQVVYTDLAKGGTLTVRLGANGTTGYEWEEADISDTGIVSQASRNSEEPTSGMMGAAGTDVWVFNAVKTGAATISFSYSRPWEGGEQATYTLMINATVK